MGDPACVSTAVNGCDPAYCTFTAGGGPTGGDYCECTMPRALYDPGPITQVMATAGYTGYSVTTCLGETGASEIVVEDLVLNREIARSRAADGELSRCSKVGDPKRTGAPPYPVLLPTGTPPIVITIDSADGVFGYSRSGTTRTWAVELVP